ncbi:MAG: helix-turn-helix domain-containing protein, partial [Myxococcota bacterium]
LLLAQAFITSAADRMGRGVRGLNEQAAERLLAYDWPGNVRELENYMERGVALARYDAITPDDLPKKLRSTDVPTVSPDDEEVGELLTLEELERKHIVRVVSAVDGNKSKAARILGVDRRTLYRKAERYGLEL